MFVPSMMWGGAEKMFVRLANGFVDAGLLVSLALADATGPNLKALDSKVRVVDLGSPRVLASIGPLASYIDTMKPDVVLSTLHYANIAAVCARSLAAFSAFSPLLILREANTMSAAAAESTDWRGRTIPLLARFFYPRADAIVANSKGAATDLIDNVGIPRSMVRVIYNPAYGDDIAPLMQEPIPHPWFGDGGPPILLSVGSLSPQKRHDLLIRAVLIARQARPVRLVILGDGVERHRLEAIIQEEGAEQFVSLPGFVENPYAYMARSSLFVLSSAWEGFPNVLVEAMACGLPVVSTDCPSGPREILDTPACGGERLGTLTPPDDAEGLARAILQELSTERDRDALKRHAKRFSADRAVRSYINLMLAGRQ